MAATASAFLCTFTNHWRSVGNILPFSTLASTARGKISFCSRWYFFLFLSRNKTKNVLIWCSVLVIVGVYTALFLSIRRTRTATPLAPNEIEIAVRFFFIVFTDCLCWMPTILLKIMALSNVYIPSNLHAWLVVFILPVNSAINPLLVSLFFSFAFSPLTFLNVILFSTHSRRQHSEWPSAIFTDG